MTHPDSIAVKSTKFRFRGLFSPAPLTASIKPVESARESVRQVKSTTSRNGILRRGRAGRLQLPRALPVKRINMDGDDGGPGE